MVVLFSTKTLVAGNYHLPILKLSVCIFMLIKTIVLFHRFVSLFNLFVSILMQSYVNSNLHVSTLNTLIKAKLRMLRNGECTLTVDSNKTRYDYNLAIMKSPKPATDNRFKK